MTLISESKLLDWLPTSAWALRDFCSRNRVTQTKVGATVCYDRVSLIEAIERRDVGSIRVTPEHIEMIRDGPTLEQLTKVFWSNVTAKTEIGCWIWCGCAAWYGSFEGMPAHRWLWINILGRDAWGLAVHHRCENKGCVRPYHLEALTYADHLSLHLEDRKRRQLIRNRLDLIPSVIS